MGSLSPIAIALVILALVGFVGLVISYFRNRGTYAGYEEISGEARQVSKALKGELFRDGTDLVVSGNYFRLPAIVRFSYSENTPGMNIRMSAPSTFTLSVVPKGAQATEGRVLVRTADDMFDARFTSRSDHPNQAKIFLGGKTVNTALHKLMCSQKTFFTMTTGSMEISELVIPQPYTAHHVIDHLESMRRLATAASEMPGAHTVAIHELQKERAIAGRLAIAIGIITAVLVVVGATRNLTGPAAAAPSDRSQATVSRGIPPIDAPQIPQADRYRVATANDLDAAALAWLRQAGEPKAGRVAGNFSGTGGPRDVAYLLIGDNGQHRVVLIAGGVNKVDSSYANIALIARVTPNAINSIAWNGPQPTVSPEGDGLLIVRDSSDRASGVVVYLAGGRVISGAPKDYQTISLE